MSNKNRIQQPYGYREQNKYTSEIGMICNAITGSSASSKEIIEKINYILYNGFFDVAYDKSADSYVFTNAIGKPSGFAALEDIVISDVIQESGYNPEKNCIFMTFENGETIEISMDGLADQFEDLVAKEASARTDEDQKIWDVIGEMGESGNSLVDMIQEEIEDRIEGDSALDDKIAEEASARTSEDQKIWDAIGEMSGDTSLLEMIEEEISARTNADNSLLDALNNEISARTDADAALNDRIAEEASARTDEDQKIWDAIGEMGESGNSIVDMIQEEISARTNADSSLLDALNNEISARTDADAAETEERTNADNALWSALSAETQAREANDAWLNSKIDDKIAEETANRQNADDELLAALNDEISARTEADGVIDAKIEQEIIDRAAADGELEGKIDVEKAEREDADALLGEKIADEKSARIYWDGVLSGAVDTEKAERESEDAEIWAAISAETAARENADNDLSSLLDDNKVSMYKVQTSLPSNVKEAYELKNTLGEVLGERINIYKDSSLKDVELVDEYQGRSGQFLKFTYILEDGTEKAEYVDVSVFLSEAEFKDGLMVTNAGEVKVKIDSSSEPYISVSPNGVKISGIDNIVNALENETLARQNGDTNLETMVTTESTARQNADNDLNNALLEEANTRESADSELRRDLQTEKSDRMLSEQSLDVKISTEITNRTNADQSLNGLITSLNTQLSTEVTNRTSADSRLQSQIDDLRGADVVINSHITNLDTNLAAETSSRIQSDTALQTELGRKAYSVDVYYKTEADSIFATKAEIPTDFYGKAEVDDKDNAIKALITAETEAREVEDSRLERALSAEETERQGADEALERELNSVSASIASKLVEVKAKDVSISVDNTDAVKPAIKANISTENNQIIKLNADGLYAKATLDYDSERNELTFTTSNAEPKRIRIHSQSEINRIYYDASNEEIVIEYTVNGARMEDVRVPVGDLIEEWRVEDGHQGAIALAKTRRTGGDKDVLSARLVLNTAHGDNAAIIDDNALYVSRNELTSGMSASIAALEARVAALEAALQNASTEHASYSSRITAVEQKNTSQDDEITEIKTKNTSQDSSINDLLNYINVNTEP